jgi:hypothetical protein
MKKTFDCVEMKHLGAKKVQSKLATMTIDEQVAYWERRGNQSLRIGTPEGVLTEAPHSRDHHALQGQ